MNGHHIFNLLASYPPNMLSPRRVIGWTLILLCIALMRAAARILPKEAPGRVFILSFTGQAPWRLRDLSTNIGGPVTSGDDDGPSPRQAAQPATF